MTDLLSKEDFRDLFSRVDECEGFNYTLPTATLYALLHENAQRREAAEKPVYQVVYDGGWHDVEEHIYRQGVEDQRETRVVYLSAPLTSAERDRLAAYDRAAKEPMVLPDYMPRLNDATLDNIINQDEEGLLANAARMLAIEVKFWHSKPLFTAPPLPVVPDAMLCDFYEVSSFPDLVRELVLHVEQLQEAVKRNVKPWEDTFPATLLPAYIERIKEADDACRTAMLQNHFPDATKMVQLSGNSEQVNHSVDATDMVNSSVIPKGCKLALSEAVAAIYFNDSSGYLSALFSVVKALSPEIMELFLNNEKAAFDATRLASAPRHGNSQSSISSSNSTGCGVNACNQSSKGDA